MGLGPFGVQEQLGKGLGPGECWALGRGPPCFPDSSWGLCPVKGRAWGCAWALTPPQIAPCGAWWVGGCAVVQPLSPSWQSNSQCPEKLMLRLPWGRRTS